MPRYANDSRSWRQWFAAGFVAFLVLTLIGLVESEETGTGSGAGVAPVKAATVIPPRLVIVSPLYVAEIDPETRLLRSMVFEVRREHLLRPIPDAVRRDWWQARGADAYSLESDDYTRSPYHRGHVRPLLLSAGSDHWPDVNLSAVIVPEFPRVNYPLIAGVEEHIAELVERRGTVTVVVDCRYEEPRPALPEADEPHTVPSSIVYTILPTDAEPERYEFPNIPEPPFADFRRYRLAPRSANPDPQTP